MIDRDELIAYLDEMLVPTLFQDYSPNGLQVSGKRSISRLVTGVSASLAMVEAAIAANADALLVHHGFFWKGEDPCLTGYMRARVAKLLEHDINLIAYHLPLDAHETLGNNAMLAQVLGIMPAGTFSSGPGPDLGWLGHLAEPMPAQAFAEHIDHALARKPLLIAAGPSDVSRVAWCTGAAQDYLLAAAAQEVDTFITGEVSERTVHQARELGINVFVAGHHATERYGVKALGEHLASQFSVDVSFSDEDNPV